MFKRVLCFAAHPDDEILGCGGLLKKISDRNGHIVVVVVTGGETGISPKFKNSNNIEIVKQKESLQTKQILGINDIIFLKHKTQQILNNKEIFHEFIKIIRQYKPDLVLTHSFFDKHRDHKVVFAVTREAVWKAWENIMPHLGERHRVKETWTYEVLDPFGEVDIVVDITGTFELKLKAALVHNSQQEILSDITEYLKGLARVRGFKIECKYGEAFKVCNILPRQYK